MQHTPHDDAPQQPDDTPEPHGVPTGRAMHIIYVCAIAACIMGLYFGIRYEPTQTPPPPVSSPQHSRTPAPGLHPSMTYAQVRDGVLGPNAQWRSVLPQPPPMDQLWQYADAPVSERDKREAMAQFISRRAYHGAPPTIPHDVDPIEHISCASCHGPKGMRLGNEVVASPMPHPHYASCTQCHVPQKTLTPEESHWTENAFIGLPEPSQGQRAWENAPPTIPHATNMRTNCMSCHGPNGTSAFRSSHPWRTSCTQCHAPSGKLNQQPGAEELHQLFLKHGLPIDDH